MSAKPIDEFLQECTGWLEKIAAAKQREEAAYAAISNVQMEKKSFRTLARGAGHVARFVGGLASAPGRYLSRLGRRLINWGSKPKANNSLQNPLTKQVSSTSGPQTRMVRTQDGTYKAQITKPNSTTTKTPGQQGQQQQTNTPGQQGQPQQTKPADTAGGKTTEPGQPKPADSATPVKDPTKTNTTNATEQQGGQLGAGNEAAMTQSDTFQKVMPYALAGGAGLLLGRSTAPAPVYMSPAMMHNNMMYQQMQQPIAPNIY